MFRPELYQQCNAVPRKDTFECLETFADKLKLRKGGCVIDLGSGDGSVTARVLSQYLPRDFKKLVGIDIGRPMVEYANSEHGDDRISFRVWDMSSEVPPEFIEGFDLVFSSYAIHWVQEQENVFSNVFRLLKDEGECLLIFIAYTPIYDVYRALARNPKWSHLMRNAEFYISPYQDITDPAKRVRGIMAQIGFNKIHVTCQEKTYLYEENYFKNTMKAICPFDIPAARHEDFMADYMKAVREVMVVSEINEQTIVKIDYTLLVVNGAKK